MNRSFLILIFLACASVLWAVSPSGTLPVMYINTHNSQQVSRETAVDATLYITAGGNYAALASPEAPLPLTIKGRGNWTWNGFDKKPYKIVFAKGYGQKLLGMHKSKHWALQAAADDYLGFLKNTVGFILSEQIGLPFTPHQVPVELVLNGDYLGLYFVTETVRVDNDRVNIHEQKDGETAADSITGGWLVEIDNYWEDGNIPFYEHNGQFIMVTPKSPEILSSEQRTYLTNQLYALNDAIYGYPFTVNGQSSTDIEDILDLNDAARFYLVQEIMEDCESYHGSCFLYKDRDPEPEPSTPDSEMSIINYQLSINKWHFGPVWDFGNSYDRHQERFIYDQPTFSQIWIGQLCQNELFYERVLQLWYQYRTNHHAKVLAEIETFVNTISSAAQRDAERWQYSENVRNNGDMNGRKQDFLSRMNWRLNWLYSQWGEGDSTPLPSDVPSTTTAQPRTHTIRLVNGQLLIEHNGRHYTLTGVPVD